MKKLLTVCALALCCAVSAHAQVRSFVNPSNTDERTDTVINATTTYFKASANASKEIGIQFIATKVSGTVAGTAYLECGIDPAEAAYTVVDSLVLTDATTNSITRQYANNCFNKWRWRVVTTGTQKFIAKAWYVKL